MKIILPILLATLATPAFAQAVIKPVASLETTQSGQPLVAPAGPLKESISEVTIPAGGGLSAHKHPYLRVVQVLAGQLEVRNLDTGGVVVVKAGDWTSDAIEQWHEARVIGTEAVRLLVIDEAPPGATVTIPRAH